VGAVTVRFVLLILLVVVSFAIGLCWGSTSIPFRELPEIFNGTSTDATILRVIRLPRVILASLVGAGLAAAGAAYQGLFRNPLADPFLIGTASGASLGATVMLLMSVTTGWLGMSAVPAGAFVGSLVATVLVYVTGTTGRTWDLARLLLAGAAVGTMLNAVTWVLLMRQSKDLKDIIVTLLGSLNGRGWPDVITSWPWLAVGLIGLLVVSRSLDALTLGTDAARSLGLPVRLIVGLVMVFAGLLTAAAVSAGGVIGFVGLVAPYLARPLVGHRHLAVIPASALLGASLLILSDCLARAAVAPSELPVGVVTALLAGPFFLAVLKRGRP
jgi:iron complex transport system permease protein